MSSSADLHSRHFDSCEFRLRRAIGFDPLTLFTDPTRKQVFNLTQFVSNRVQVYNRFLARNIYATRIHIYGTGLEASTMLQILKSKFISIILLFQDFYAWFSALGYE